MRTREKGYKHYNFEEWEVRPFLAWCKSINFSHRNSLMISCRKANPEIADDLYFSIVRGVSYDRLEKMTSQYYAKNDFYAYRRLALAIFRDALKKRKLYPFM